MEADRRSRRPWVRRALGGWSVAFFALLALVHLQVLSTPAAEAAEPGITLVATPTDGGDLLVRETVVLADPTAALELGPVDVAGLGDVFASSVVSAEDVSLTAGDVRVEVPGQVVTQPTRITLETAGQRFELRYRLVGSTVRTEPSTAGRALAAVGPLSTGVPGDLPVLVTVAGDRVRNLICPTRPPARQTCASDDPARLSAQPPLPHRDALVVVQLDLPATP